MTTTHSPFGASSSARWMACPGSIKASEGKPNPESPYAAEGTYLHDQAAMALDVVRHRAAVDWRGFDITAEQQEVVRAYVETIEADVLAYHDKTGAWPDTLTGFLIETKVSIPELHTQFYGTADCIVKLGKRLSVYDLKCGAGVAVEIDYDGRINPQLGYYMLGAIVRMGGRVTIDGIDLPPGVDELETVVVQPRLGGVKRRIVALTELYDLAWELTAAANTAGGPDAPKAAGKHCKFCLAKSGCEARRWAAHDQARLDFKNDGGAAADLSAEELSEILKHADEIEAWINAVREEAKARIEAGVEIPGYGLRRGRPGNRKWVNEDRAREALIAWGLSEDIVCPRKLVSPAEAERLAKLHVGEIIDFADMVERKEAASAVARTAAASDFAKAA